MKNENSYDVMIMGGGAAGFFAAIHHALSSPSDSVVIIEKRSQVLGKVKISGGGRCNVTHACFDPFVLKDHYPRGGKALLSLFLKFQPQDTINWFESRGVPLKVESDNRVFPVSNESQSIIDCLIETAKTCGVHIWTDCTIKSLSKPNTLFEVLLANQQRHYFKKCVIASGSHPQGYDIARSFGHTIIDPIPSLFTFKIKDKDLQLLSGLSVQDTAVWCTGDKKSLQSGPTLITHQGLSGPAIIKLSAWQAIAFHQANYHVTITIDWLATLSQADTRVILEQFKQNHTGKYIHSLSPFNQIPLRLWHYLLARLDVNKNITWSACSAKLLLRIIDTLKLCSFQVTSKSPFKDEFVTCGGIPLPEINFKNMESKYCSGLHFVGEVLNIDGVTGGFNFQNAWSTGYVSALTS
ncbi:aminoacetone oxidase family FAD-binding enzyme [Candidatus Marinamargulisbacteria bacterium SCGC AG-414-C22]|nr:aminoacetone oxidase family FAD-binding enzyme [Candidatus Marinamargulisbacteria bacterium SCGC AG-414-C22]